MFSFIYKQLIIIAYNKPYSTQKALQKSKHLSNHPKYVILLIITNMSNVLFYILFSSSFSCFLLSKISKIDFFVSKKLIQVPISRSYRNANTLVITRTAVWFTGIILYGFSITQQGIKVWKL